MADTKKEELEKTIAKKEAELNFLRKELEELNKK
jgi:hypothetical protein